MATRGYLKTSGSSKRLRFVKSGYDATSESVPPNKVIFDSNDIGTLSIVQEGSYTFTGTDTGATIQIASWNLNFVPLCTFQFDSQDPDGYYQNILLVENGTENKITVSKTGIFYRSRHYATVLRIRYQAYRIVAA